MRIVLVAGLVVLGTLTVAADVRPSSVDRRPRDGSVPPASAGTLIVRSNPLGQTSGPGASDTTTAETSSSGSDSTWIVVGLSLAGGAAVVLGLAFLRRARA